MIYNKDYIPQLATILAPLHDLNRNEGRMEDWRDDIHGAVMRKIKQVLTSAPLLLLPDPSKKFIIHVDSEDVELALLLINYQESNHHTQEYLEQI